MKNSQRIRLFAMVAAMACVSSAAASERRPLFTDMAPATGTPVEMYSFADLYRLTVGGALPTGNAGPASASAGASSASAQAALAESGPARPLAITASRGEEARFLIGVRREPQGWLMALAGLVLAGWVAARRLGYPLT